MIMMQFVDLNLLRIRAERFQEGHFRTAQLAFLFADA